jgi:hypothetical protein
MRRWDWRDECSAMEEDLTQERGRKGNEMDEKGTKGGQPLSDSWDKLTGSWSDKKPYDASCGLLSGLFYA